MYLFLIHLRRITLKRPKIFDFIKDNGIFQRFLINSMNKYKWIILSLTLIFADQLSKWIILRFFGDLAFFNMGSAFSLPIPLIFIYILTAFFVCAIILVKATQSSRHDFIFAMLISGAIGNVIDRVRLGYVIDFIDLKVWPVFNFADIFLTLGALLFIYFYVIKKT